MSVSLSSLSYKLILSYDDTLNSLLTTFEEKKNTARIFTKIEHIPLADPSGGRRRCAPPQQDQFLSFSHMFLLKSVCIGGWCPPNGSAPPQREILDPPLHSKSHRSGTVEKRTKMAKQTISLCIDIQGDETDLIQRIDSDVTNMNTISNSFITIPCKFKCLLTCPAQNI